MAIGDNFAPIIQRPRVAMFRVSEAELAWIDEQATARGLSRSELLRAVLAGRIDPAEAPPSSGPPFVDIALEGGR